MDEMSLSTKNEVKSCIHARKIQAFVSCPEHKKFSLFKKHLSRCKYCQNELAREQELAQALEGMIPSKLPLESQLSDIKVELQEAIKGLRVVDRTSYQFKLSKVIQGFSSSTKAVALNLFSVKNAVLMLAVVGMSFFLSR